MLEKFCSLLIEYLGLCIQWNQTLETEDTRTLDNDPKVSLAYCKKFRTLLVGPTLFLYVSLYSYEHVCVLLCNFKTITEQNA